MKDDLLHGNGFEPPRPVGAAASRPAPVALSPLVWQARRVRKRTPSLPEACGERSGVERRRRPLPPQRGGVSGLGRPLRRSAYHIG